MRVFHPQRERRERERERDQVEVFSLFEVRSLSVRSNDGPSC